MMSMQVVLFTKLYIGNWKNDYQQGIGTSFNENKDRMISYWKEGAKNGWTVVYYPKRKFGPKQMFSATRRPDPEGNRGKT